MLQNTLYDLDAYRPGSGPAFAASRLIRYGRCTIRERCADCEIRITVIVEVAVCYGVLESMANVVSGIVEYSMVL